MHARIYVYPTKYHVQMEHPVHMGRKLKQLIVLEKFDHDPTSVFHIFSEGTRMDNVHKNIGVRRYAFNSFQLSTFPHQYK